MDPTALLPAVKLLLDIKKTMDSATLTRRIGEIESAVDRIGRHLADQTVAELKAGFSHLQTAQRVSDPELRSDELVAARQTFNRLAHRSEGGLEHQYAGISADHLAALAHLGNCYYFLLRDAPQPALVSAYACAERFPALGVSVLPASLFARDWRPLVPSWSPADVMRQYDSAVEQHRVDRRSYGLDMLWRVPAAAGAVLAGLAGGTVAPSLAGRGLQYAIGILSTSEQGLLPPDRPDRAGYLARAAEIQLKLAPIIADARERRLAAEALSSA